MVGECVGTAEGCELGWPVGSCVGFEVLTKNLFVGIDVDGIEVVGSEVGQREGQAAGCFVGCEDGCLEGCREGCTVG